MIVNVPPVELDSVTTTLVAFTVRESATEPDATVNVVLGEESERLVRVVYVGRVKSRV